MAYLRFKNKIAIITGSSQGIGKATAIQLCKEGVTVVLNGRNLEKLENTRIELSSMGYNVISIQGDVTSNYDCEKLIKETIETFGRIDILINNGSSTMNAKIETIQPQLFVEIFNSNAMGALLPTLAALPHLKKSKGSVIFISSLGGLHGLASASAYSMGKMALTALWQSLQIELSTSGIHFGICYLSFTENEDTKRMISADGELIPVPKRIEFFQRSREKVAINISSMIKRRKSKAVISPLGNVTSFLMRHFPSTVLFIFIRTQKRPKQVQYEISQDQIETINSDFLSQIKK